MARRRRKGRELPADRRAVAALAALVSKDPLQLSGRAVADGVAAAGEAVSFVQARMYLWAAALAAPEKIPSAIGLLKYPAKAAAAEQAGLAGSKESRERADARRRMAGAEVSAALTLSPVSGDLFVDRALNLVGELPATWAMFERGGLDQQRARMVHDRAMRVEDPERVGEFEARALAMVPGRAPAQLERLLDRLWLDMHPVAAAEAEERAFQQRCTGRRDLDHAMSRFYAELRVEDAVMVQELIDAIARTLDEQDGRTLAQRRADVFVSIFARLAEGGAVDVSGILAAAAVLAADPDLARHAAGDTDTDGDGDGDGDGDIENPEGDSGSPDDEGGDENPAGNGEGLNCDSPDGDGPDSEGSDGDGPHAESPDGGDGSSGDSSDGEDDGADQVADTDLFDGSPDGHGPDEESSDGEEADGQDLRGADTVGPEGDNGVDDEGFGADRADGERSGEQDLDEEGSSGRSPERDCPDDENRHGGDDTDGQAVDSGGDEGSGRYGAGECPDNKSSDVDQADGEDISGYDVDDQNVDHGADDEGLGRDHTGEPVVDTASDEQDHDLDEERGRGGIAPDARSADGMRAEHRRADDQDPDERNSTEWEACGEDSAGRSAAEGSAGDAHELNPAGAEPVDRAVDSSGRSADVGDERAVDPGSGRDEMSVEGGETSCSGEGFGSGPAQDPRTDDPPPDEDELHHDQADAAQAPTGSNDPETRSGAALTDPDAGTTTTVDPDEQAPGPAGPADTVVDELAWAAAKEAKEEARARRVREFATRLGPRCHQERPCEDAHENCTHPLISPAPGPRTVRRGLTPHLLLTLSLDTYAELAQHPGHLEHYGAVSPDLARTIAALFTSVQLVIIDPATGAPVGASKRRYVPSTDLARKVRALSRTCSWYGCSRPAERCDTDHHIPYNHDDPDAGGATDLCNLEPYCRFHHRLKTHTDWTIRKHPDRSATFTTATGRIAEKPPPATTDPGEWTHTDTWITTTTDATEQVTDADEPPPF
ncbi:HNH endonuclease signature motif containing protein [Nakamurella alba]|nr:HNH endonuclease signature motif containing protein [Nakamurella alba]